LSVRSGLVVWLLVATLLAGCTSQAGAPAGPTDGGPVLTATATTGVIRGVVVDEAIRPVQNATVVARGPEGANRTVITGHDGVFGLADLAPGTWFVSASKLAYTPVQQSIEVVAGIGDPSVTKLQLVFVPGQAPFLNEVKVDAFVECIVPGANLCAILYLYPCVVSTAIGQACSNFTSDSSYVLFYDALVAQQRIPDFLQAELVWESTQAVSDWLNLRYSAHEPADGAGLDARQAGARGPSPIVMPLNHTTATKWDTGTKKGIAYEVFGCVEAITPYITGCAGFVLNQRVSFFFDVFYGYTPPDGWQFSKDGPALPPR
jgi:hypothetical protein